MPVVVTPYRNLSSAEWSLWSTDSQATASFIGVSSIGSGLLIETLVFPCPFDTKIITASVGIAHGDISYRAVLKKLLNLGLDATIGNIPLCNQPSAARIRV